jgi:hypothetical protein
MKRELARRSAAGLDVVLYWHGADTVTVFVHDANTGEELELAVDATHALDAFHHPYAYAAGSGVSNAQPAAA